jgi:hypothetical protein
MLQVANKSESFDVQHSVYGDADGFICQCLNTDTSLDTCSTVSSSDIEQHGCTYKRRRTSYSAIKQNAKEGLGAWVLFDLQIAHLIISRSGERAKPAWVFASRYAKARTKRYLADVDAVLGSCTAFRKLESSSGSGGFVHLHVIINKSDVERIDLASAARLGLKIKIVENNLPAMVKYLSKPQFHTTVARNFAVRVAHLGLQGFTKATLCRERACSQALDREQWARDYRRLDWKVQTEQQPKWRSDKNVSEIRAEMAAGEAARVAAKLEESTDDLCNDSTVRNALSVASSLAAAETVAMPPEQATDGIVSTHAKTRPLNLRRSAHGSRSWYRSTGRISQCGVATVCTRVQIQRANAPP